MCLQDFLSFMGKTDNYTNNAGKNPTSDCEKLSVLAGELEMSGKMQDVLADVRGSRKTAGELYVRRSVCLKV